MQERKINFSSRRFAKLSEYKLVFNKKATDGNFAYANIEISESNIVEGALYEFPDNEIINLDKCEGYPKHYDRIQVIVTDQSGNSIKAITYVAQPDKIVNGLLPKQKYLGYLLSGEDILSKTYFDNLKKVATLD